MHIILLLSLFLLHSLVSSADLDGLVQVHMVFRHGDRTPISPYPNDPYKDYNWPGGLGQLTNRGKKRHHDLGAWLRSRYAGWLSEQYDNHEIVVRSTDTDRTLMSAMANLAGLFPPKDSQVWDTSLLWQPIPVHTVPQSEDYLLSSHAHCPRFDILQDDIQHGDWMKNIYKQNEALFKYVSEHSGDNITDIVKLDYVYDTLLIEDDNGLTLPNWTHGYFPDGKFKELRDLSFTVDTLTDELKRLKGGPWIKEVIEHTEKLRDSPDVSPDVKVHMYSAHDTTVAPILHTLGVFNGLAPPYASLILLETFKKPGANSDMADTYLRVSYHNETDKEPYILTLPGCQEMCPLQQFKEIMAKYIPVDILKECGLDDGENGATMRRVTLIAALSSSVMAATVLVATLSTICCKRKQQNSFDFPDTRYQRVGTNEAE